MKNVARNARNRPTASRATASSTCTGVAEVPLEQEPQLVVAHEIGLAERDPVVELRRQSGPADARGQEQANNPTATTLADAAPSALETLFATLRNAPT
jgi:hypothetical protein